MYDNPWLFNGVPFDDAQKYYGFIYLLINKQTGKRYIGRKYFIQKVTPKGKTRKVTGESHWRKYYSSNAEIKSLVKQGVEFERHILSLHELQRDVNYGEVRAMFKYDVLEAQDLEGNRLYYNDNISGKYYSKLQQDFAKRAVFSEGQL